MLIPTKGGWKIKLESGRVLPKVYTTKASGNKRIAELERHGTKKK